MGGGCIFPLSSTSYAYVGIQHILGNVGVRTVNGVDFNIDKMLVLLDVMPCNLVKRPNELAANICAKYDVYKYSQSPKKTQL